MRRKRTAVVQLGLTLMQTPAVPWEVARLQETVFLAGKEQKRPRLTRARGRILTRFSLEQVQTKYREACRFMSFS